MHLFCMHWKRLSCPYVCIKSIFKRDTKVISTLAAVTEVS